MKSKLGLKLPTDPRWVDLASMQLEHILTDHAYCELKAATACISIIQSYPDKDRLVNELSPVVTEEWGHFRLVLKELDKRGLKLGYQRKDEYVHAILGFQIKGASPQIRFVDRLLTCALIEARSCERFRLLSLDLDEESLRRFYYDFMIAEANHYRMFLDLAKFYHDDQDYVTGRWQEFLDFEAKVLDGLRVRGDRMH